MPSGMAHTTATGPAPRRHGRQQESRPVIPAALRQFLDRLAIYLPVALMGLLALGSWWLVRNAPGPDLPAALQPPKNRPDYFMKSFSVKSFDAAGRLQTEVRGREARHYPDSGMLEIDGVRVRSFGPDGHLTVATARRALSNADGSEIELFGQAVVTREPLPARAGAVIEPRLEFRSEYLHAYTRSERLRSAHPVTLLRGSDRFTANGMDYDHPARLLQLHGRVRGLLLPGGNGGDGAGG